MTAVDQVPPTMLGTVELEIGTIRLRLYCYPHEAVHTLTAAEVERAIYVLVASDRDAYSMGYSDGFADSANDQPRAAIADEPMHCPLELVACSREPAGYAGHTEDGVAGRASSAEWIAEADHG